MKKRQKEDVLRDIVDNPDQHHHNFEELTACCNIAGTIDTSLMEEHSKHVNLGINGGIRCDTVEGPCACGAWH